MDYTTYTVEDFVADEYFIQWVKRPTEESNAFWQAWLSKNPGRKQIIKEAREFITMLQFEERRAPEGKFLEVWGNIMEAENRKTFEISSHTLTELEESSTSYRSGWWYKAAAVFFVLAVLTYVVVRQRQNTITVQTAFGESQTLFLPDSTKVTLNGNSILRYAKDFNEANREVWLDGEAFFAVVHKKDNQNFLVHTQELQVEVLGTRFNVNSRRGKSQVVLEEGKVKLDIPRGEISDAVVMQPGDMVEFSTTAKTIDRKKVAVSNYSSWRNNQLVFVSTSLQEIAQVLEDSYGYEVIFKDEQIRNERFTGSASVENLPELFNKLNILFELNIQQEGKKLTIQYK